MKIKRIGSVWWGTVIVFAVMSLQSKASGNESAPYQVVRTVVSLNYGIILH